MKKFLATHFPTGVPNQSPKKGENPIDHAKRFLGLCAEAYLHNNDSSLAVERSDRISAYAALREYRSYSRVTSEVPWIKEFIILCQKVAVSLKERKIFTSETESFTMLHDFLTNEPYDDEMPAFFNSLNEILSASEIVDVEKVAA